MNFLESLKGLSFEDAVSTIANSMVHFAFRLLIAAVVFYVGRFIITRLYRLTLNVMTHRKLDASLITFALSLVKMVLYFILIVTIIGILGIETSSFLALFASAGVAIGMAMSGTLQNFAGGVLILILKPYKVGDFIETQGYMGTVKSIQIFFTVINTPDNKAIIIPNGGLSTGTINNYSFESYRRVDWEISLSYGTDFEAARAKILEIVESEERVVSECLEENAFKRGGLVSRDCTPFIGLNKMSDSSIDIVVRAWTKSADYWGVYFDLNRRFYTELPQAGFSFPFPQLDVHIESPLAP